MSDNFIGEIRMFGGNFAPRGWAFCDGQLLSIASYSSLFSLLGTFYGGDGRTTFGLPDMRSRVPLHMGDGPGLTPRQIGAKFGQEYVTLLLSQIPSHNHLVQVSSHEADSTAPSMRTLGVIDSTSGEMLYRPQDNTDLPVPMANDMIAYDGGNQPHYNMMPFNTVNFIIALSGIFPSRS